MRWSMQTAWRECEKQWKHLFLSLKRFNLLCHQVGNRTNTEQIIDVKMCPGDGREFERATSPRISRALSVESHINGYKQTQHGTHISNGEQSANYVKTTSLTPIILLVAEVCRIECSLTICNTSCTCVCIEFNLFAIAIYKLRTGWHFIL